MGRVVPQLQELNSASADLLIASSSLPVPWIKARGLDTQDSAMLLPAGIYTTMIASWLWGHGPNPEGEASDQGRTLPHAALLNTAVPSHCRNMAHKLKTLRV